MFDGRWRSSVEQVTRPVGATIRRTGLTADHFTGLGLVMAVATAVAIGSGRLGLGLVLIIASAVPDMLDGAVAKASGTASTRGAFFDSVSDRVTDSLVLGGIAWYLAGRDGGHAAMLPFAVLGASLLISYERAKAESLGFDAKGGLMERAERIIVLCIGVAFSAILVPILWVMLALTLVTAAQRFAKVWRQASAERPVPPPAPAPVLRPELERRWREWREGAGADGGLRARRGATATWRERREATTATWRERRTQHAERPRRRRARTRP